VPQSSEAVLAKVREMELPTIERQDNCQVAVSLSLANDQASLPVYGCLCDRNGRAMTNVCARRRFLTTSPSRSNTRFARSATLVCATGLPRGVVLMEAGYGNNSELRAQITALDLTYVAGILSDTTGMVS
jgi:hypothetical protein